jgi:hypothetical protein
MDTPQDGIEYERLDDGERGHQMGAELFFVCLAVCLTLSLLFWRMLYVMNNVVEAEIVVAGRAE